jgi:hypothetical protein
MFTTENGFPTIYRLFVSSFIHFTTTVGTNFQTWLDGNRDEGCKALEESSTEFLSLFGEFINFLLLFSHMFDDVFHESLLFKLLQEGIDQTRADFFPYPSLKLADYAVAVAWPFVEEGEYVEAGEVRDELFEVMGSHSSTPKDISFFDIFIYFHEKVTVGRTRDDKRT